MSNIAIRVDHLSKLYHLGRAQQRHDTLRDALVSMFKRANVGTSERSEDLWALKDVSFEVKAGEAIGIIGRNGAGKSTLLKVLSRITEPTSGRAEIHGRIASLLEVGTGFHPELTGRENIYLNGAILGMHRGEIERKFDQIVAFAEIERFLDTPVKRYSSGMYVRLAFAVAAHLEPEILLVDEVLAVGDAAFQKKCLGKMGDVAKEGRTILFVSHNMLAMQSLCQRVVWLDNGQVTKEGEAVQVVSDYLRLNTSTMMAQVWDDIETAPGNDTIRVHRMCVRPEGDSSPDRITMDTPLVIELELWNLLPDVRLHTNFHVLTEDQVVAFSVGSYGNPEWRQRPWPVGLIKHMCHIPGNLLNSGYHRVSLLVVKDESVVIYRLDEVVSFQVLDMTKYGVGWYGKSSGVVRPALKWDIEHVDSLLPHRSDIAKNGDNDDL
jgi:lipopolysaccharide transport system ATP-binding protein